MTDIKTNATSTNVTNATNGITASDTTKSDNATTVANDDLFAENTDKDPRNDEVFAAEQAHLTKTYQTLVELHEQLNEELEKNHKIAAQDLRDLSSEVRLDFGGADETMETLAAIETLNAVIDAYNQYHDFSVDKLRRILLALQKPYFAMVQLEMRPEQPPRTLYIGGAGITDSARRPLIIDWRSPVAETYYNQQMGPTSYVVNGKTRNVTLTLRRQYDIVRDTLLNYFDTSVAIQDSMLLNTLKKHRSEKLQAITATIQREQNKVVRHEDVPVLLVDGIAGSGKTSVLLQRIAYLFYNERETLRPEQVFLFTPNHIFQNYIDQVLPSLGESNPHIFTWKDFIADLGLSQRDSGIDGDVQRLKALEQALPQLRFEEADFKDLRAGGMTILKAKSVASAVAKFSQFSPGPKLCTLVKEELHDRADKRLGSLAKDPDIHEKIMSLDLEEQVELFGETINPTNDEELLAIAKRYVDQNFGSVHDEIDKSAWLKIDRIGMRLLNTDHLSAAEWLYLMLLLTGSYAKDARYVLIDEVQDYTQVQLMILALYFKRAHFMLLGDQQQAIFPNGADFATLTSIFERSHGSIEKIELTTSYRSSPEITQLFATLLSPDQQRHLSSVHRRGEQPVIASYDNDEDYLTALRTAVHKASEQEGLTAIICAHANRVHWLKKQLDDEVVVVKHNTKLPTQGVVLITLPLAKGLEFDGVIIPDAQAAQYDTSELSHKRLYTAISRAMHHITILAQGPLTELLG